MVRPASRERRETAACPDPKDHLAARATAASVEPPVPSAPPARPVCPVLKVQRELKVPQVPLVLRETPEQSVLLVLLAPQVR